MGPYDPATGTQYGSFKQAAAAKNILGLSEANAADFGLVVPTVAAPPAATDKQRVVRNAAPTEGSGGWQYGWTAQDLGQDEVVRKVNAERQRRIEAGAAFTVAGVANPIPLQGRAFDQTVYLALLTRANGYKTILMQDPNTILPDLTIRDAADVIHTLTPDQMISLISQGMTWFESVMATSWAMKDATKPFEAGIPADFTDDRHWP